MGALRVLRIFSPFCAFFRLRKEGIRKDWARRGVRPFDCAPLDRARGRPFGLAQGKQGKRGGGCWPIRKNSTLGQKTGRGGAHGGAIQSGVAESCLIRFSTQLSLTSYLAQVVNRQCAPQGKVS